MQLNQVINRAWRRLFPWNSVLSMLFAFQAAQAASSSWNIDASGNWITDANWNPTAAPGASSGTANADVATFGFPLTADRVVTVDASRNLGGITFSNASTSRFSLNGGKLLLSNGGVIQTSAGNGNHTDTIGTAIEIQGNAGTASFTAGATSSNSLLSIADVTGVSTGTNTTVLTINGTNTGSNTISGAIGNGAGGGKLALTKSGAGTWVLSGTAANSYSGLTNVIGGTLLLQKTSGIDAIASDINLGDGTAADILRLNASNQIADTSELALTGTASGNRGWFQLNGQNETIGGLASSTAGAGLVDNGHASINSSLTLHVAGTKDFSGLIRNSSGAAGTLALVKTGSGTQILSGTNTYSGGTNINEGTIQLGSAGALGSSGNIIFGGGTLRYTAASQNSELAGRLKNSTAAIRLDTNGASVPLGGAIDSSNTGGLTRSGTGTLQFYGSSPNAYSGTTSSIGGNLYLNKSAGIVSVPGDITLGDGSGDDLMTFGQNEQIADTAVVTLVGIASGNQGRFRLNGISETIGGLASASTGAGMIENGSATSNSTLTLNVASSQNYSGVIRNGSTGTLALVKSGSGTQTLSGTNTYGGGTTLESGTISFANGALGSSGNISMNGGTLQWYGANTQDISSRLLFNNGAAATFDTNGNDVTFASSVGNSTTSSLVKSGAGKLTLAGAVTYSGNTSVNAGTLALSGSASLAASSNISVAAGAVFDVSGLSAPFALSSGQTLNIGAAGATLTGSVNCGSGTVILAYDNNNPAAITSSGGLTLSGSTSLTISTSGTTLPPGTHKLIAKLGGGSVTGTLPVKATVINGSSSFIYAYALSILDGELYLTVTARDHSIVVMGSSVADGYGSSSSTTAPYPSLNGSYTTGYAGLLQSMLIPQGWTMNNLSIGGQKTQDALNRYAADLAPLSPTTKYVLLGYSLANELLWGSSNPAVVVATFKNNLTTLITQCRNDGFQPIIGLNYPRNGYSTTEYEYLKACNLAMNDWDVPSVNFLGALDDGYGHYVTGYYFNDNHPNDAGHQELFYSIVPSLFDAINAGKTSKPQLGAVTDFARINRQSGVTEPMTFTPEQTVRSFTKSFRVRTTNNGTIAAIRTGLDYATLEIRSGQLVYRSVGGQEITAAVGMTNGGWHDVALSFRYALQQTALIVDGTLAGTLSEQFVPAQFILGGPSASGRPEPPLEVDFQNWCIYRSAWNQDEAVAQMQGNLQQASMEICAPLDDASFTSGLALTNRAQSLSAAMVNGSGVVSAQDSQAPSNLVVEALPGRSAALSWSLNGNTASQIVIERRQSGTTLWSDVTQLAAGSNSYTHTGLLIGISYDYRVAAIDNGLRGNYSNIATVATGLGTHPTILVDFGPNDGTNGSAVSNPDSMGQYWNSLTGVGGGVAIGALSLTNLITTTNAATSIGLNSGATGWAANGFLNGGLMAPSQTLLGNFAVANATGDYFLTSTSGSLTISNLDSTATYRLRFFGTRNITETRVSRYSVTGGNGTFSQDLTTSGTGIGSGGYNGNNNTISTISGVTPNGGNQIQVNVSKITGTFAHLGIMEIMTNHVPQAQALSYSANMGDSLTIDVMNDPNSPTDADSDGLTITSVTGDATIVNDGTGFTYQANTAGVHQFDYTVTDPYGGTATSTVTITVQATYESWASDNGIPGADFATDNDGDGLSNGIEYAIGGNPLAFTAAPALVAAGANYTLVYQKGLVAASDPSIQYSFEISADLINWTEVAPSSENSSMVSYLLESGVPRKFVRLKVSRISN